MKYGLRVLVVPVVAIGMATVSLRGQIAGPRKAAPFDGAEITLPLPLNILPTIPFLL